jgi:hypothetical protein
LQANYKTTPPDKTSVIEALLQGMHALWNDQLS